MQIKSYHCTQFGGLRDKKVELDNGLNVILGPNEAGKSTMVEGIYSTIFKQPKLRNNLGADKEFKNRFMPKPSGDFIDGNLTMVIDNQQYTLTKTWGSSSLVKMTLPDGSIIQDERTIDQHLGHLLNYGEKTYGNIIFSKQQDLKNAINLILSDRQSNDDISTILRKVVMELDGISIDKLREQIQIEHDLLFKRWDPDKDRPENPNQQYKVGLGEIIKKYYEITKLKTEVARCQTIEEQSNQIRLQLKELEQKSQTTKKQVDEYSKVEMEVNKRAALQPELNHIKEKEKTDKDIASNWPKTEMKLEFLEKELAQVQQDIQKQTEELTQANKIKDKTKLANTLSKIEKNKTDISELEGKLTAIPPISKEHILDLEKLKRTVDRAETAIKAGKMQGKILANTTSLWITTDFNEKEQVSKDTSITANGYIKIELDDKVSVEIQSGEFNFSELKETLTNAQDQMHQTLEELKIQSIEEGKLNLEKINKYTTEVQALKKENLSLLDDKTYEDLKEIIAELDKITVNRSSQEIEGQINILKNQERSLSIDVHSMKSKINDWTEKFEAQDKIFGKLAEYIVEIKTLEQQLENLAPLPEEFHSPEQFSQNLATLRENLSVYQVQHNNLKERYYQLQNDMPESSTEEMSAELKYLESDFNRLKEKGRSLLKVKEIFEQKLESMDQNSFEPLIKAFTKFLTTLTLNNYSTAEIDDNFKLEIQKGNTPMPIELLSAGTKDCVALALRLAIIEVLYDQSPGIIVLDDCLVDLDPQRKQKAVQLIKQFAQNNQVIFTTCNPETAQQLGGRIINL